MATCQIHMIFHLILIFFLSAPSALCAPQLIKLNSFPGNETTRINATGPFSIYVSASSVSDVYLKRFFVESNQRRISLFQLKNNKMNPLSGLLQPYRVTSKEAWIASELSESEMSRMQGLVYITTKRQMNDNAFYVFDVDKEQTINLDERNLENCTLVFLNTNFSQPNVQSTLFSKWSQMENSTVSVYYGIPENKEEKRFSQIFSNPVSTTENMKFFPNVEPFSLSLPAFYMKTYGSVQFTISPGYHETDGTTTTAPTTTGLVMKPVGMKDLNVTVTMIGMSNLVEYQSTTMTGCNAIGSMSKEASVSCMERRISGSANGFSVTPVDQILGWSTPEVGNSINVYSKSAENGQFFIQYYMIYNMN